MSFSRSFRQFRLLVRKNCLVMKRSKAWTVCEFVLPIFLALIVITPSLYTGDGVVTLKKQDGKGPASLKVTASAFTLVYSADEDDLSDVTSFMKSLSSTVPLTLKKMEDSKELYDYLKKNMRDYKKSRKQIGVYFDKFDKKEKKLSYSLLYPIHDKSAATDFKTSDKWSKKPTNVYESSDFLYVQWLIDKEFTGKTPTLEFYRMPEPKKELNTAMVSLLDFLPVIFGIAAFLPVMHATREISNEKQTVKDFLSVMGLSTPMFYFSHMFTSFVKCVIIFTICSLPIFMKLTNASSLLFFIVVLLYCAGAVVFAALVAAIFSKPSIAFKVVIFLWIFLAFITPCLKLFMSRFEDKTSFFTLLLCLNANGAFAMATTSIKYYHDADFYLTIGRMFDGTDYFVPVGVCIIFMLLDIAWMLGVIYLADYISRFDINFATIMWKLRKKKDTAPAPAVTADKSLRDAIEIDAKLEGAQADIDVSGLIKIFGGMTEPVVNGVSFKGYNKQVAVLLGHNGAGKSTVFSMISGMVQPTAGSVKICQQDVAGQAHTGRLGYCPQGNALFERLTVAEHLWLIHGLKGAAGNYEQEGQRLIGVLGMTDKWKTKSAALSGGMKRKLCVCMAMIGESSVILLDEPTAGMDPGARRDVERLLADEKKTRTVLLTTHYMDEAEALGDRIIILSKGHVISSGSTEFLKKRFGSGYILTVVLKDGVNPTEGGSKLMAMTKKHVPDAIPGETRGKQVEIVLPKHRQQSFPALFGELEKSGASIGVDSFGLSLNTLEQVFLKVLDLAHPVSPEDKAATKQRNTELINSQQDERRSGMKLIYAQMLAIFYKKAIYQLRHLIQLLLSIGIPLVFLIGLLIWTASIPEGITKCPDDETISMSTSEFGPARAILLHDKSTASKRYKSLVEDWDGAELIEEKSPSDVKRAVDKTVLKLPKSLLHPAVGAVFDGSKIGVLYNGLATYSAPVSLNLLSNALLGKKGYISTTLTVYNKEKCLVTKQSKAEFGMVMVALILFITLSLVTSNFAVFVVEEKRSKFAHQQSLTGIWSPVFWASALLFDLLLYLVVCLVIICMLAPFSWGDSFLVSVVLFSFAYAWGCIPFIYAASFLFTSATKANLLFVIWQIVFGLAGFLFKMIFVFVVFEGDFGKFQTISNIMALFLPSYGLLDGLMAVSNSVLRAEPNEGPLSWANSTSCIGMMIAFGSLALVMFILLQLKSVKYSISKLQSRGHKDAGMEDAEDEDVRNERVRVGKLSEEGKLALDVQSLVKWYGKFRAVNHLTLGVENNECFALLGVNGAGKTTTFDILTGQSFPTFGTAMIDQKTVTERVALGYCPQFDAVMMEFTGKETLQILAIMYGFKDPKRKVELVLKAVGMEEHKNKQCKFYSGGQRRKLSVGLALLAQTRIVILDEPTAGVDPKARRDIWELLSAVRDTSSAAILLTSHSMEECEALCSRIAILNKGRMVAVGASQALKSKYGNSYNLILVLSEQSNREGVLAAVAKTFPGSELTTNSESLSSTMKWKLPKQSGDMWSTKFAVCMQLAQSQKVKDMCLAQSSLEDAFLILAKQENGDNQAPGKPDGKEPKGKKVKQVNGNQYQQVPN